MTSADRQLQKQQEMISELLRQIRHLKFYIEELEAELDEGKNDVQEF